MSGIDERVVGMRFDNSKFTGGVKTAMDNLDALKKGLKMDGAAKGLNDLDAAGKKFSLANIGSAAEGVSTKFLALATIGITALSNIVNKAVDAGSRIASALTIDPIKAGFDEYELKMGSIQTILSNTARYGTQLSEVTDSLDELNTYADKTIYNFGDMTKNIGLFTNAGLRVEEATSLIKGFSNEAASSGTNAQGAASAAYQLSQALSAGTIRLMDWRSLQNVGMGNKNMQRGIIEIADAMGTLEGAGISSADATKDFNGSLEKGWLSAEVMSNYLKIMAGDMDEATQKSLGLSDATIETFMKQQKMSEDAATKVRTLTQLYGTLQESVGSSWASTFDMILGDFDEATELFTNVNNTLGELIGAAGEARNKIVAEWVEEGGREKAIEAISAAFKILMSIMGPVKEAFSEVFPPITGKNLADITQNILDFINGLKPSEKALADIKSTAKGFFAILSIGAQIIGGFIGLLANLLGFASQGAGGFLDFTGGVGEFLVSIDNALKSGEGLNKFFETTGNVIKTVIGILLTITGVIIDFGVALRDIASGGFSNFVDNTKERLASLGSFFAAIQVIVERVGGAVRAVAGFFEPFVQRIGELAKGLGGAIADSFSNGNYSAALDTLNTGLLAGIGVLIFKFIGSLKGKLASLNPGGGIVDGIKSVFGGLTDTLSAMQGQLKAKTLITIAGAVGILTVSVIALSMVDPAKLGIALGAISVMFIQLGAVMAAFDRMFAITSAAKLTILATALVGMATAMLILAGALAIMSAIPFENLLVGLVGLAGAMAIMSGAMLLMSKAGPGAILGSAALVIASVGITVLAGALKLMSTMSWDDIGRSMTVLGASLAILAVGLTLMAGSLPGAAALVIASVGILVLSAALKVFSTLSWDDIGRAMTTLGATLAIMAVGLTLMVASLPGAAALLVASAALLVMSAVLKVFATMSWEDIGQAMVLLGGTLGILALGLTLMVAALPGALALVVVAGALAVLAPVLMLLGSMSWEQIGTGLGALALTLGLLAAAGMLITPALPGLFGLGAAILLIGVGVLAAGVGVAALAIGLTALSVAGGAAVVTLTAAVSSLASLIPFVMQQIGLGLIEIVNIIGQNGPAIVGALTTVLLSLIEAIVNIVPPLVDAIVMLVTKLVEALVVLIPLLVDAGMRLIIGILDGVAKNIGKVIEKGVDVIVALLDGIGKAVPRLTRAGADLIIDFINGLASTIRAKSAEVQAAGRNLADAIIQGMTGGIRNGITSVVNAARDMAGQALSAAKSFLGINSPSKEFGYLGAFSSQGFAGGMISEISNTDKAATKVAKSSLDSMKLAMRKAGDVFSFDGMDLSPTIRPVMDLSAVKRGAGLIGGMIEGDHTLSVDGATARANAIAAKYGEYQEAMAESREPKTVVNLEQNNYSPKALTQPEIYRQTNNQMSILKGELEKNAKPSGS